MTENISVFTGWNSKFSIGSFLYPELLSLSTLLSQPSTHLSRSSFNFVSSLTSCLTRLCSFWWFILISVLQPWLWDIVIPLFMLLPPWLEGVSLMARARSSLYPQGLAHSLISNRHQHILVELAPDVVLVFNSFQNEKFPQEIHFLNDNCNLKSLKSPAVLGNFKLGNPFLVCGEISGWPAWWAALGMEAVLRTELQAALDRLHLNRLETNAAYTWCWNASVVTH